MSSFMFAYLENFVGRSSGCCTATSSCPTTKPDSPTTFLWKPTDLCHHTATPNIRCSCPDGTPVTTTSASSIPTTWPGTSTTSPHAKPRWSAATATTAAWQYRGSTTSTAWSAATAVTSTKFHGRASWNPTCCNFISISSMIHFCAASVLNDF